MPKIKKKGKIYKIILTYLILLILFFTGLYVFGVSREPYKYSTKYILNNQLIISNLGKIHDYHLSFLGYSYRTYGAGGRAKYNIVVKGDLGNGVVALELKKQSGVWSVINGNLKFEDETINLMEVTADGGAQR